MHGSSAHFETIFPDPSTRSWRVICVKRGTRGTWVGPQVASSTRWSLEERTTLDVMIFMDTLSAPYSTTLRSPSNTIENTTPRRALSKWDPLSLSTSWSSSSLSSLHGNVCPERFSFQTDHPNVWWGAANVVKRVPTIGRVARGKNFVVYKKKDVMYILISISPQTLSWLFGVAGAGWLFFRS
jgi:hypothetical protein